MLPAMAVIAGAYVILRCLEMISRPATAWGTGTARTIMTIAAAGVIVLTFWQVGEILAAGATMAAGLR